MRKWKEVYSGGRSSAPAIKRTSSTISAFDAAYIYKPHRMTQALRRSSRAEVDQKLKEIKQSILTVDTSEKIQLGTAQRLIQSACGFPVHDILTAKDASATVKLAESAYKRFCKSKSEPLFSTSEILTFIDNVKKIVKDFSVSKFSKDFDRDGYKLFSKFHSVLKERYKCKDTIQNVVQFDFVGQDLVSAMVSALSRVGESFPFSTERYVQTFRTVLEDGPGRIDDREWEVMQTLEKRYRLICTSFGIDDPAEQEQIKSEISVFSNPFGVRGFWENQVSGMDIWERVTGYGIKEPKSLGSLIEAAAGLRDTESTNRRRRAAKRKKQQEREKLGDLYLNFTNPPSDLGGTERILAFLNHKKYIGMYQIGDHSYVLKVPVFHEEEDSPIKVEFSLWENDCWEAFPKLARNPCKFSKNATAQAVVELPKSLFSGQSGKISKEISFESGAKVSVTFSFFRKHSDKIDLWKTSNGGIPLLSEGAAAGDTEWEIDGHSLIRDVVKKFLQSAEPQSAAGSYVFSPVHLGVLYNAAIYFGVSESKFRSVILDELRQKFLELSDSRVLAEVLRQLTALKESDSASFERYREFYYRPSLMIVRRFREIFPKGNLMKEILSIVCLFDGNEVPPVRYLVSSFSAFMIDSVSRIELEALREMKEEDGWADTARRLGFTDETPRDEMLKKLRENVEFVSKKLVMLSDLVYAELESLDEYYMNESMFDDVPMARREFLVSVKTLLESEIYYYIKIVQERRRASLSDLACYFKLSRLADHPFAEGFDFEYWQLFRPVVELCYETSAENLVGTAARALRSDSLIDEGKHFESVEILFSDIRGLTEWLRTLPNVGRRAVTKFWEYHFLSVYFAVEQYNSFVIDIIDEMFLHRDPSAASRLGEFPRGNKRVQIPCPFAEDLRTRYAGFLRPSPYMYKGMDRSTVLFAYVNTINIAIHQMQDLLDDTATRHLSSSRVKPEDILDNLRSSHVIAIRHLLERDAPRLESTLRRSMELCYISLCRAEYLVCADKVGGGGFSLFSKRESRARETSNIPSLAVRESISMGIQPVLECIDDILSASSKHLYEDGLLILISAVYSTVIRLASRLLVFDDGTSAKSKLFEKVKISAVVKQMKRFLPFFEVLLDEMGDYFWGDSEGLYGILGNLGDSLHASIAFYKMEKEQIEAFDSLDKNQYRILVQRSRYEPEILDLLNTKFGAYR